MIKMVKLLFKEDGFEVDLTGLEKFSALKGKLFIPYSNLSSVDESVGDIHIRTRLGGTSLGEEGYNYGRFQTTEGYGFYAMKSKEKAFVIHLVNNEYNFIALEVEDKEEAIKELRSHITNHAY